MIAVAAFPAPSLDQISACSSSPIAAAIGVRYPANNVMDRKIAAPCIQLDGCCRWQEPSTSRAIATEERKNSRPTPGQPGGNMEKSRCTRTRVRWTPIAA